MLAGCERTTGLTAYHSDGWTPHRASTQLGHRWSRRRSVSLSDTL